MRVKNEFYKKSVLKELYFNGSLSCIEISFKIKKSIPVTSNIINELIMEGMVKETGLAPSSGGRRPLMYALQEDQIYTISIAMDQLVTRIALMDMHTNRLVKLKSLN